MLVTQILSTLLPETNECVNQLTRVWTLILVGLIQPGKQEDTHSGIHLYNRLKAWLVIGRGGDKSQNGGPTQSCERVKIWKAEKYAGPETFSLSLGENQWIWSRDLSQPLFIFWAQQAQKPPCASFNTISSDKLGHFVLFLLLSLLTSNCLSSFIDFQIMRPQGLRECSAVFHHPM